MFLSIIVPVYNGDTYLAECLDSLLCQGVSEEEYEVLLIDDGSTDETGSILAAYCAAHANFRRFAQNHLGVSAARNLGLREAKGDYVWFVDADDFIRDNALSMLQEFAATDHYDRILFDAYHFFESLTAEETEAIAAGTICSNSASGVVAVWSSLFRRAFLLEIGQTFDENLTMSEDTLFLYEMQLHHPVQVSFHQVLYFWRRNPASTTMSGTKVTTLRKMDSMLQFAIRMDDYYQKRQGELSACANYLMSNLWLYLLSAAELDCKSCRAALRRAAKNGLFPYYRPRECTLQKTYLTTRTDLFGRVFDFVGMHLHRRWGFAVIRIYRLLRHKL